MDGAKNSYDNRVFFRRADFQSLEIIRQPFKRGEVVWRVEPDETEPFVVVNNETNGNVDVCCCRSGLFFGQEFADIYERRSED